MEVYPTRMVLREVDNDDSQKGWVCPTCGSSISPNKDTCPKCEKHPVEESVKDNRKVLLG